MIKIKRIFLLALVGLALTSAHARAADEAAPLRILRPLAGSVLPSQMDTEIVAALAPEFQDPAELRNIQFRVTRIGGPAKTLAVGDLRSRESLDQARAIWRHAQEPSGDYVITALFRDRSGNLYRDRVQVTLNRAPVPRVRVLQREPVRGGAEVTLQVIAQDAEQDPIRRVVWTPGDGSESEIADGLAPFHHFYSAGAEGKATYIVTVTVEDARGGSATVQRDIDVTDTLVTVRRTNDCGCTAMDIFSVAGNNSFVFCQENPPPPAPPGPPPSPGCVAVANPVGAQACPANTTPFRCPLGPFAPGAFGENYLGWRFEINAHLDPRTNDVSQCSEGQVNRSTLSRGGAVIGNPAAFPNPPGPAAAPNLPFPNPPAGAVVGNPNPYPPAGGPSWGADDYTGERNFKRHLPALGRIQWLDAPRIPRNGAASLADHAVFVAWVSGNLGTCWCQFEYNHEWTAAGGRTGPGGGAAPGVITRLGGLNCN